MGLEEYKCIITELKKICRWFDEMVEIIKDRMRLEEWICIDHNMIEDDLHVSSVGYQGEWDGACNDYEWLESVVLSSEVNATCAKLKGSNGEARNK